MKSIKILSLLCFISAFAFGQDITVKGTTRLNTNFKKYKSYGWAKTDETDPSKNGYVIYSYQEEVPGNDVAGNTDMSEMPADYIYSYNVIIPASDANVNSTIQKAIAAELEGRGYKNDNVKPDLLVSYKVLEGKGKIRGYVNDQPDMVGGSEVRTPNDTTFYDLEPGTLLINLIDTKSSQVVWDGFASGLIQGDAFLADPAKLKEAVHRIFDKFKSTTNVSQVR